MKQEVKVAVAQFEAHDGDKQYNLDTIENLSAQAARRGAQFILFHELSVTGYTFLENLSRDEVRGLAETVPGGESVDRLISIAGKLGMVISAGVVEQEGE